MGDIPSKPLRPQLIGTGLARAIARKINKDPDLPLTRPARESFEAGITVQRYGFLGKRDRSDPEAIVTVTEFGKQHTEEVMDKVVALLEPHYFLRRRREAEQPGYMIYHQTSVVVSKKEK